MGYGSDVVVSVASATVKRCIAAMAMTGRIIAWAVPKRWYRCGRAIKVVENEPVLRVLRFEGRLAGWATAREML